MGFKEYYTEGNHWEKFDVKKNNKRWTFTHEGTGKRYFIKIDSMNIYDSVGSFLRSINAKSANGEGKKNGYIDHFEFATNIVKGKRSSVLVKPNMVEKIKGTWILEQTEEEAGWKIDDNGGIVIYEKGDLEVTFDILGLMTVRKDEVKVFQQKWNGDDKSIPALLKKAETLIEKD